MADRSRRDLEFQPEDMVIVRLHPYRQTSVAESNLYKLRRRFYGPFKVLKRVGAVAYKLELPATAKIHNVFHVSKLKSWRQDEALHTYDLPTAVVEGRPVIMPLSILRQRRVLNRQKEQLQVLVEWAGLPLDEASWMELKEFQEAYPDFDLEGKVGLQEGGNDTSLGNFYRRKKRWAAELKAGNSTGKNGAVNPRMEFVSDLNGTAEEAGTEIGAAGDAGEQTVDAGALRAVGSSMGEAEPSGPNAGGSS